MMLSEMKNALNTRCSFHVNLLITPPQEQGSFKPDINKAPMYNSNKHNNTSEHNKAGNLVDDFISKITNAASNKGTNHASQDALVFIIDSGETLSCPVKVCRSNNLLHEV